MSDWVGTVSDSLEGVERLIRRVNAQHVNGKQAKDAIRSLARSYFGDWRPKLVVELGREDELVQLDECIQDLVRFAQVRTRLSEYKATVRVARRAVGEIELLSLRSRSQITIPPTLERRHQRILESLSQINRSAANSYEQGLLDLHSGERKSWRGTSVEFREALREVLDTLAPDQDVTKQPGFKLESDAKGPTMRQKAMFIFRARRPKDPQAKAFGEAIDVVEELIGKFVRSVYARSSVAVHVSDSKDEARKVRDYVTLVLAELLEASEP